MPSESDFSLGGNNDDEPLSLRDDDIVSDLDIDELLKDDEGDTKVEKLTLPEKFVLAMQEIRDTRDTTILKAADAMTVEEGSSLRIAEKGGQTILIAPASASRRKMASYLHEAFLLTQKNKLAEGHTAHWALDGQRLLRKGIDASTEPELRDTLTEIIRLRHRYERLIMSGKSIAKITPQHIRDWEEKMRNSSSVKPQ